MRSALICLLISGGLTACDDANGPSRPSDDARAEDSAVITSRCGDAAGTLPEGLIELSWDDGQGFSDIAQQDFSVVGNSLQDNPIHEAVRFELEHPARIHGFSVQYGTLPASGAVAAGLYPDFGHNGFDFWQWDPLWSGDHCAEDLSAGEWVTYVFDAPVEVPHPELVYVAHRREAGPDDAAWSFDGTIISESCERFDDCHSAINLPELTQYTVGGAVYYAYNGLSFSFAQDFLVRLHVEYTDDVVPEERIFQKVDGITPSSRQSWADYDNDGFDDMFGNGATLWRNQGDGTFIDASAQAGLLDIGLAAHGGVWGDYDNDGCIDLLAFAESGTVSETLLQNNCDGTFTDVTTSSRISDAQSYNACANRGYTVSPTPAAAWWDIDGDGLLDLYLSNFICWDDYSYYQDKVFHNNGDGTFVRIAEERGFTDEPLAGRGATPIDHDQDGDVDLLVNNYVLHQNLFYDNQGDGTVLESAADRNLDGNPDLFGTTTYYGHTIGAAWGDIDNDGDFDVVQANLAHPRFFDFSDKTQVLLNDGSGTYTDIQGDWRAPVADTGLRFQETHSVPVLGDFDNDGHLDLTISAVYDGRPTDFYWGNGDGSFTLDSYHAGITREGGWGMAAVDFDNDGDLDLSTNGHVFENTLSEDARGAWLQIKPVGNVASNWAAIGATVRVYAGGAVWLRHISGGSGQGSQDSLTAHVGLGDLSAVSAVEVDFPGGGTVRYDGPFDTNQRLWLLEDGQVASGWTLDR